MSESESNYVPQLRFPEFSGTGNWRSAFGDKVFDQISNREHASDLPVLAITQEYGAIPRSMIDYHVSVADKSIESYKVVEVGDFIISLRSFQGGIEYSKYKGICSPAYVILRLKADYCADYFRQFLKTEKFITQMTKNLEGLRDGKMISYKQFSELCLPTPNQDEQQKIANCLSSIDELISSETKRLEGLRAHKKGLMQSLFPAEGKTVPKLRFPGFRGATDWKTVKLENICTMQAGKFVSASAIADKYTADSYPCFGGNGLRGYTKTFTHDGKYTFIGRQGALCGNVNVFNGKFHATEHAVVTIPLPGISVEWLFYALILLNLNRFATGQAQPGLSVEVLAKVECPITKSQKKQQKIADCLSSIDDLISAETRRLEALKEHKKGLMQQLFPSLEEATK